MALQKLLWIPEWRFNHDPVQPLLGLGGEVFIHGSTQVPDTRTIIENGF